jgi:branched-chain amino acid transport system ATP-binding protein
MPLDVSALTAGYGKSTVIHDASLRVGDGEIVSVVGANGAGKSTLLRCVAGLHRARHGRVEYGAKDITRASVIERIRAGIAMCPESRQLFPSLTVEENLRLGALASRTRFSPELRDHLLAVFPVLRDRLGLKAGSLSGGEQQMTAVARALIARPRLLLLDEPCLGLSVGAVSVLITVLDRLRTQDGISYLIAEQNPVLPARLSDRILTLRSGRLFLAAEGPGAKSDLASSFFDDALALRARDRALSQD